MGKASYFMFLGLLIGTIFEIGSFLIAHVCQLIFGSTPIETCRIVVSEFYFVSLIFGFLPRTLSYIFSIIIIVLIFGIIGFFIGKSQE